MSGAERASPRTRCAGRGLFTEPWGGLTIFLSKNQQVFKQRSDGARAALEKHPPGAGRNRLERRKGGETAGRRAGGRHREADVALRLCRGLWN